MTLFGSWDHILNGTWLPPDTVSLRSLPLGEPAVMLWGTLCPLARPMWKETKAPCQQSRGWVIREASWRSQALRGCSPGQQFVSNLMRSPEPEPPSQATPQCPTHRHWGIIHACGSMPLNFKGICYTGQMTTLTLQRLGNQTSNQEAWHWPWHPGQSVHNQWQSRPLLSDPKKKKKMKERKNIKCISLYILKMKTSISPQLT